MKVTCPTCQSDVEWNDKAKYRPFCSKRCQLIDLGEWSNEEKAIPSGANKDEESPAPTPMDIEEIEAMLAEESEDFFKQ